MTRGHPTRAELKRRPGRLRGTSWHLFAEPWRGAPSFAGQQEALAAIRSVEHGESFGLDYPVDAFTPGMSKARKPVEHVIYANHPAHRDDYLDSFYLQSSTQLDGLRHRRADDVGFYADVPDERITAGAEDLGVQVWAEQPIVTRGVLLDLAGFCESAGMPVDHGAGQAFGVELVEATLRAQSVEIRAGDVVMVHTGWSERFLGMPEQQRLAQRESGRASGLAQSEELLDWAWDSGAALLAADNFAVESLPPASSSPFIESAPNDRGMMHQEFLAKLGLPLGELWRLGPLARRMRELDRWSAMLVIKPLNVTGATGSPANATAVL